MVPLGSPTSFGVIGGGAWQSRGTCLRREKKKPTFVVVFHWKRRVRKEMAGAAGEGREEKWRICGAEVRVRAVGMSAAGTGHLCWGHVAAVKRGQSLLCKWSEVKKKNLVPWALIIYTIFIVKSSQDNLTKNQKAENPCLRTASLKARRDAMMEIAGRDRMLYSLCCADLPPTPTLWRRIWNWYPIWSNFGFQKRKEFCPGQWEPIYREVIKFGPTQKVSEHWA